jgi:hypothetical protein
VITRLDFCQDIISKAEQKFGKKMGELDVYYAPPEVGVALEYLGHIADPSVVETINSNPTFVFVTRDGKSLTYRELLYLLPDDKVKVGDITSKETSLLDGDTLKSKLGDRKFYRVVDVIEGLTRSELDSILAYLNFLKKEFDRADYLKQHASSNLGEINV